MNITLYNIDHRLILKKKCFIYQINRQRHGIDNGHFFSNKKQQNKSHSKSNNYIGKTKNKTMNNHYGITLHHMW